MSEEFRVEAGADGEIKLPGEEVTGKELLELLLDPMTEAESAEFRQESERIIEATKAIPGQADIRLG